MSSKLLTTFVMASTLWMNVAAAEVPAEKIRLAWYTKVRSLKIKMEK